MTSLPSSADASAGSAASLTHERTNAARRSGLIASYMELTKARLSALVVMTTAVGYVMAAGAGFAWATLGWTVLGTALAAGSAGGLNQFVERHRDARMHRTRSRPLPSGAMRPAHALIASILMGAIGVQILLSLVNVIAGALALLTILLYLLAYTPMKPRTSLNTLVGAVCGAIPPMIGVVAATGTLTLLAWVLGGILFVWQIPHFLALAWLYRDDYARGGFIMLPMTDRNGEQTTQVVVLTCLLLVPLTLALTMIGATGTFFALAATVLGIGFALLGVALYRVRSDANARRVFLASITYLPLLLIIMIADRAPGLPEIATERGTQPSQTNSIVTGALSDESGRVQP